MGNLALQLKLNPFISTLKRRFECKVRRQPSIITVRSDQGIDRSNWALKPHTFEMDKQQIKTLINEGYAVGYGRWNENVDSPTRSCLKYRLR